MFLHFLPIQKLPKKISLRQKHLIESFQTTRPSLSASDVAKYQRTYVLSFRIILQPFANFYFLPDMLALPTRRRAPGSL